jgi:HSP20 family molecular chaperone IbpA
MSFWLLDESDDRFRKMMAEARRMEDRTLRALKEFEHAQGCMVPLYELRATPEGCTITVDMPGVKKDEVTLLFQGDYIAVTAPCVSEAEKKKQGRKVRYFIDLALPRGIDEKSIKASMKGGLLRIDMKKAVGGRQLKIE